MKTLIDKSKYLSLLLRHRPEEANLSMDAHGWINMSEIAKKTDITIKELQTIVKTDNKQRYTIRGGYIRANQGHSLNVDVDLKEHQPPKYLYHGTVKRHFDAIMKEGLKPMGRKHVHLSKDFDTAYTVGKRRDKKVYILRIDTEAMYKDGLKFYLSDNKVWLTETVPVKYMINYMISVDISPKK